MCARWENFVVHLRTSRALSEPFLSSSQYSVNSISSHTMSRLAEVFLCSEQFYMHKNTSASLLIVWELIELTEYCQLLKKGFESALEVRRCTTKFSHLAHMRRRRSPVPMQVYIPYRTVHWDVNLHWNRWSPSAHVCKVGEFRGTSAHFQSTFRALFKQLTILC